MDYDQKETGSVSLLREMSEEERPREKLIAHGAKSLSITELIAVLLRTGIKGEDVLSLSRRIYQAYDSDLRIFYDAGVNELILNDEFKGIGKAKASVLVAAIELGRRIFIETESLKPAAITSVQAAADYLIPRMCFYKKENFAALLLDTKNKVIKLEIVSVGTLSASLVHPRELFYPAIRSHAAKIILTHNHPSGEPEASMEDIRTTKSIIKAGELLQIPVVDHIIVGSGGQYHSMRQSGVAGAFQD